jgi:tetratricopeptide (TPR) repeat protein
MLIAIIVIMAIFISRMPKTLPAQEITELSKRQVQLSPSQVKIVWRHVREWIVLTWHKISQWVSARLKNNILKRRKQDASAVSHMFEESGSKNVTSVPAPSEQRPVMPRPSVVPRVPSRMSRSFSALKSKTMRGSLTAQEADKKRKTDELIRRAKQYLNEQRNKDAEELFIEAATLSPRDERIYLEMGNMYLKAGSYADAKAAFREVVKLSNTNLDVIAKLGLIAYREKKYDEAKALKTEIQALEEKYQVLTKDLDADLLKMPNTAIHPDVPVGKNE